MSRNRMVSKSRGDLLCASASIAVPDDETIVTYQQDDDNGGVELFGEHEVNTSNRYDLYARLVEIDDYVFNGVSELGLALAKGFTIAPLSSEYDESVLDMALDFVEYMELDDVFGDCCFLLARDGTVPILTASSGGGVDEISFLPMNYTTLIPVGYDVKYGIAYNPDSRVIMKGRVGKVVLNEIGEEPVVYDASQVELVRLFHRGYEVDDIYGRPTLGLYGRSLIEPIVCKVKYLQNILYSHDRAVYRYGQMKLHFEYDALKQMLVDRNIEPGDARRVLQDVRNRIQQLRANEDIVTAGFTVKPIETTYSMNVVEMKESLERDITNALMGTEASAGKGKGQTFASAYMAENRKMLVMEGMRAHLRRAFNHILWRHLELAGVDPASARTVGVKLDPIKEPDVAVKDLFNMTLAGILDPQVLLDKVGVNAKAGVSADEIKSSQKALLRDAQSKYGMSPRGVNI